MNEQPRFLIGFGERLTEPIPRPPSGGQSDSPYDPPTARRRLAPSVLAAADAADQLAAIACPNDRVVSVLTLHPAFLAKSYYPGSLLRSAGMQHVGSRPSAVVPEAIVRRSRNKKGEIVVTIVRGEDERPTTELFVAITRRDLRNWARHLSASEPLDSDEQQLNRIEAFRLQAPSERLRLPATLPQPATLEVVLHVASEGSTPFVVEAFEAYAKHLGVDVQLDRRMYAGGLCFVPVSATGDQIDELARFSFLRVARVMPRLRRLTPAEPSAEKASEVPVILPDRDVVDRDLRVAVFDGGVPAGSSLHRWVRVFDLEGSVNRVDEYCEHGQHVTSALLFGSLEANRPWPAPYAYVDHFQVLDEDSAGDPYELYDVIRRIEGVLEQSNYEFVNLSIGPELPVEDDEVHSWTAWLDDFLADGRVLATVAVGNNGALDRESGNSRLQVPADCVNALAVGASTSAGPNWDRAPYSALGPGRSPGVVKPDVLAFGGGDTEPFRVVGMDSTIRMTCGTSFAAPAAMRAALGTRALFGTRLDPLALKALLIHTAEAHPLGRRLETGWGRVADDIGEIVLCGEGMARVVYQGELAPGRYVRARLPLPARALVGKVTICATLTFATAVDPEDPGNYTRGGVEVVFRPHAGRFKDSAINAMTRQFFSKARYAAEAELRRDALKWETVLHERITLMPASLDRPVFDLHYNARESGQATQVAGKLRYAMVVTVQAPRMPSLYDDVLRTYATQLEALVPVLDLPLRVRA